MTDFRIEAFGIRWEEDLDGCPHEPGMCDACDADVPPESCEAWCEVSYPLDDRGNRRIQRFTSGGLYGICGADEAYRKEIEAEQIAELRAHCAVFGVVLP